MSAKKISSVDLLSAQYTYKSTLFQPCSMMKNGTIQREIECAVEFRHVIAENSAMFYEQYILGGISLDEFKVK